MSYKQGLRSKGQIQVDELESAMPGKGEESMGASQNGLPPRDSNMPSLSNSSFGKLADETYALTSESEFENQYLWTVNSEVRRLRLEIDKSLRAIKCLMQSDCSLLRQSPDLRNVKSAQFISHIFDDYWEQILNATNGIKNTASLATHIHINE